MRALGFDAEHFALYQRYQRTRHPHSGMAHDNMEQYTQFLLQSTVHSRLIEFREPAPEGQTGALRMVSLIDILDDGISAVYTFFDPDLQASFGTFNVLWQIELARDLGLPYVYLGYWIEQSQKMSYKIRFSPVELFQHGQWQTLDARPAGNGKM